MYHAAMDEITVSPAEVASITRPRCRAHSKTGKQCALSAIAGGTVCRFHGGAAPQVKRAAQLRLQELINPAIAKLARIMTQGADRDAIRAVENILDRAGVLRGIELDAGLARELLIQQLVLSRDHADDSDPTE